MLNVRYARWMLSAVLALAATAQAADKPVVGVAEFRNQTSAGWWSGGVGWELSGMLSNELVGTGSFVAVERDKLGPVLAEQDLAEAGRIAPGTGAEIGRLTGAQYLVMGTVTAYERDVKDTGGGISFKGFSVGGKKDDAYIAVDIRVVDTTTGNIEYVRTVEARASGSGIRLRGYNSGLSGNLASESKTPAGKAIRAVLVEITDYLECAMVKQNRCLSEYDAKDDSRREKTKDAIELD